MLLDLSPLTSFSNPTDITNIGTSTFTLFSIHCIILERVTLPTLDNKLFPLGTKIHERGKGYYL